MDASRPTATEGRRMRTRSPTLMTMAQATIADAMGDLPPLLCVEDDADFTEPEGSPASQGLAGGSSGPTADESVAMAVLRKVQVVSVTDSHYVQCIDPN